MKKSPIIFIAMLIALAFTACQMNTDDTGANPVVPTTPTSETEYAITIVASHGTVELDKTKAKAGETVKLTITPDSGYVLDFLSVKTSDTKITATIADDKTSTTFTMPNGNVSVEASFKTATATPAPTTPTEATSYKVVYGDLELKAGLTLAQVNAYITQISLVETTDYSIDKVKGVVTLTESGYNKLNSYFATNGEPTTTEPTNTDNGGEGDGTGGNTNPPAIIEYTVSVADGIKGGYIEVSLDKVNWTKLSTSKKYAKGTKIYVRAVADKHYQYIDGLKVDDYEEKVGYIVLNANVELTANFVVKYESLTPGSLEFNGKKANLSEGYRCLVRIDIKESDFSEDFKDARLGFGFPDGFYGINKRIGSTSNDKYFYVYDTVIPYDIFESKGGNLIRIFVAIYLSDEYELPDGEIYVLFPNLKEDGKGTMYVAEKNSSSGTFEIGVDGANSTYSEKYYFDVSQL